MDEKTRARFARAHRLELIATADAGDVAAGGAMLQHAMAACRRATAADEADHLALQSLADALDDHLKGMPLARALRRERGAGNIGYGVVFNGLRVAEIAEDVNELQSRLKRELVERPIATAIERTAAARGCSVAKVRKAWQEWRKLQGTRRCD